jgi:hypothetical protein
MKIFVVLSIILTLSSCLKVVRGEDKYIIFVSSETISGFAGINAMDYTICDAEKPGSRAIINRGNGILENFKPDASYWNTQGELLFETNEEVTLDQIEEIDSTIYYRNGDTPGKVSVWTGHGEYYCGSEDSGRAGTPWTEPIGPPDQTFGQVGAPLATTWLQIDAQVCFFLLIHLHFIACTRN